MYYRQHARLPCSLPAPGACSNSCPLSRWSHPTTSSCVVPFSCCPQSFSASGSFPVNQLFTSGGQSIGTSASAFPMNIQGWFPLGLTALISLLFKGLSRVLQHHSSKASILRRSAFFMILVSHPYITIGKTIALTGRTFVGKVMSLLFNKLSRLVIAFLPRNKRLLISWLQSPSAVIWGPPKIKPLTVSIVFPSTCLEVMGPNAVISFFACWASSHFFTLLFYFHQGAL